MVAVAEPVDEEEGVEIDLGQIPGQYDFVVDPSRYVGWIGGRGCSKTASGTFKVIQYLGEFPGAPGIIIAPSYPQLGMSTMLEFFRWFPPEYITHKNMSPDQLYIDVQFPDWPEGTPDARIYFRSASNPDSIRGFNGAWAWVDEAQLTSRYLFNVLAPCLRRPGYRIQTWFTGTPAGHNFLYQMFFDSESLIVQKHHVRSYYATSYDNPFNAEGVVQGLEDLYAGNPQLRDQEIMGKFVAFKGLVHPLYNPNVHMRELPDDIKFTRVVGAVDFGLTQPSCIYLLGQDKGQRVWIFEEFYQARCQGHILFAKINEWQQEYNVRAFFCDPSAKDEISMLRGMGIKAYKANNSIELGVRVINNLLEVQPGGPGLYVTPRCRQWNVEALAYCHDSQRDELVERYSDTIKGHQNDHAMNATRYGIVGLKGIRRRQHVKEVKVSGK